MLPIVYIETLLAFCQYFSWFGIKPIQTAVTHHRNGEEFEVKGYETGERVKVFNLRVFLRVKMLNILGNLRVSHQ